MTTIEAHPAPTSERPTEQLEPSAAKARIDALALLDHRARSRAVPAGEAPGGSYLELQGEGTALLFALGEITHIGRGLSADLRLDHAGVSRRHAIVARSPRGHRVLDDRSANGTFVNGERTTEADLHDGDVIFVGPVRMRYVVVGAAGDHPAVA